MNFPSTSEEAAAAAADAQRSTQPTEVAPAAALPSDLTIGAVGELRARCLAWLTEGGTGNCLIVDAAAVVEADAAGVQLLQSLAHSLAARQRRLQLDSPSSVLRAACEGLGLQALLDDRTEVAA
jgi:anti-anti-sigma regulatory factor